jgi:hypothetical protein
MKSQQHGLSMGLVTKLFHDLNMSCVTQHSGIAMAQKQVKALELQCTAMGQGGN